MSNLKNYKQMERNPRKTKTDVDLTIPQSVPYDGSCFGVEYAPRTVDCQQCHDSTLCNIKYAEYVKANVKHVESTHPMLDKEIIPEVDGEFGNDMQKLAKKYFDEGQPLHKSEIQDALFEKYHINDARASALWIERWIVAHELTQIVQ
jgi:hypothetical protein